jgi:iron complex outermembrane receptor protein
MSGESNLRWKVASLIAIGLLCTRPAFSRPADFDVPAGFATETIGQFARQAGIALVFPYELATGRRTQAVRGRLEPEAALAQLLRDSGLVARRSANGALVIGIAAAESAASRRQRDASVVPADDVTAAPLSEVVVTGSRLELGGMATPTPVTVVSSVELDVFHPGALVDALARLPHFLNNDTPETQSFGSSGAAGSSILNLRGVGSIRTLTLIDGRRMVPSSRFGTVDIALVPRSLVRRIEVVTGGASAAYGSDAISGVTNVLLNTSFDGLRLSAQSGITELGDYPINSIDALFGTAIGDDTHLTLAAEGFRADGVRGYGSRSWFASRAAIATPLDYAGPREVTVRDARATGYTAGGLITSGPLANTQFLSGGVTAPFVSGAFRTGTTQAGGDGIDQARDLIWIVPSQTRGSLFGRVSKQFTAELSGFVQMLGAYTENEFGKDTPSFWGPWEATIYRDNAFLSQDLRARMVTANIDSFRLGRIAATDLGRGMVANRSVLTSTTAGFAREMPNWRIEGYYQYGHNRNKLAYRNAVRIDRIYRAIDAVVDPVTGRTICRSTLTFANDGCVPINLFGEGSPSPAARDYVTEGRLTQVQSIDEHVAELSMQGDALDLPAGPVRVAAGVNWRREAVHSAPHRYPESLDAIQVGPGIAAGYRGFPSAYLTSTSIFERGVETRTAGQYTVREAFAETAVPLFADRHQTPRVTLNAALREAHYSGSGTIPAWKGGMEWLAHPALRLRATRSRDVRAGSLAERLDTSGSGVTIIDRFLTDSSGIPRSYAINLARRANPLVEPEKGDTSTIGFVFQPAWSQSFALSADYFDIRITDAIALLGAQNIIDRCFNATADLCPLITRDSSGQIARVENAVFNIARVRSRGVDAEMHWRSPLKLFGGGESIAFRMLGNYSFETSTSGESSLNVDRAGQSGVGGGTPRWQLNLSAAYQRGALQLAVQEQVISKGIYNAVNVINGPNSIDDNTVPGVAYTNLRMEWQTSTQPGLTLFAHVANLFDRAPPDVPDWGFGGSMATNESLFDPIGRRYSFGVRIEF